MRVEYNTYNFIMIVLLGRRFLGGPLGLTAIQKMSVVRFFRVIRFWKAEGSTDCRYKQLKNCGPKMARNLA